MASIRVVTGQPLTRVSQALVSATARIRKDSEHLALLALAALCWIPRDPKQPDQAVVGSWRLFTAP